MLKKIIITLLLCSSVIFSCNVFANPEKILRSYIKDNFGTSVTLTSQQITQLAWVMNHSRRTNDMDQKAIESQVHIEVLRALTRLYCMQLLKQGDKRAYDSFIIAQVNSKELSIISFHSFKQFSKYIQNLSAEDYELLQTATILSAISLSDQAALLSQNFLIKQELNDNLDFLATTLRLDANMYPITKKYANDRAAAKKLLYVLFPPQTNFRHMLYTEGGSSMFHYLRSMIQHQYINQDDLDLWYAYWIINIAGFRGHVSHAGSIYLTEDVARSMSSLKQQIDHMLYSPNYNPLVPYLEFRAQLLGLQNLPEEQRLLLAHLGSLMRMYSIQDGKILLDGFEKLNVNQQRTISRFFMHGLKNNTRQITTYVPALFGNTVTLLNGDKSKAIAVVLPIYSKAIMLYTEKIKNGELNPDLALNFNSFSASKNLRRVIAIGQDCLEKLKLNASAEVML